MSSLVTVITDFCRNVVDDVDVAYAFQLAAYELTENLVKYSTGKSAMLKMEVQSTPRGPELVLTAENEAAPERLADVDARLHALERAPDPIAHYDALVRESLDWSDESRLGLGRLRAEGMLEVAHQVRDNVLSVQVRRPVRRPSEDHRA